jgi:DNA modification methylase
MKRSPDIRADDAHSSVAIRKHNFRMEVRQTPIEQLKSYLRKLRKQSSKDQEALDASVSRFGLVLPIIIDAGFTIVSGEALVESARRLGYTHVPTTCVDHLDENEIRLLRVGLNKLGSAREWDSIELGAEFGELLVQDIDLDCTISGFDSVEIDNLVYPSLAEQEQEDPDDTPVGLEAVAITRPGDIWNCGDHRVLCGSSLSRENVGLVMAGEQARMVFTDAPYNQKISGHVSGKGKNHHREFAQASGEMTEAQFIQFLTDSTTALAHHCVDGALLYMCMDHHHMWEILSAIRAAQLSMINLAVWVKGPGMGSMYRSSHELVFIAKKGKASHRNNIQLGRYGRSRSNIWRYPGLSSFGRDRDEQLALHPTPKNVTMVADAIRDTSLAGEIVLDGFLGSGTSAIACERTGRRCRGIDIDPLYVDAAVRRWQNATGRKAILDGTDKSFEEIEAERLCEPDPPVPVPNPRPRIRPLAA